MPSGKAHIGIREFVRNRESLIFDTLKEEKVTERKYHGTQLLREKSCDFRDFFFPRHFVS